MDKSEDQFLPAQRDGKKTHITTRKGDVTMKTGNSQVTFGQDSSVMHQEGSSPVGITGPLRMSGKGTAKEMGVLFSNIRRLRDQGSNG